MSLSLKKFKNWSVNLFKPRFKTVFVKEDIPTKLKKKIIYVITEDDEPWHVAMLCPCGCLETLQMNLIPDERPVWRLEINKKGYATLNPSIWKKKGCKSHFWFREGCIFWCDKPIGRNGFFGGGFFNLIDFSNWKIFRKCFNENFCKKTGQHYISKLLGIMLLKEECFFRLSICLLRQYLRWSRQARLPQENLNANLEH
jgi:hypothetical protein